ncbi:23825_t:CDS:2 [Cetraspora pellucida]|uniref:23825_t:CDS:1 n=1 Tax=Cetraspora pellucida TaxID=1433469 RepID=A0A9N8VM03_9GLOM|nr:23825_t:CDS:2 [Cetraspora pellucida]
MNPLYNQIVLFGDSITQFGHDPENYGWVAALQSSYVRKFDVLNRGFSGYNTEWAKILLPQLLPKNYSPSNFPKIILLTIFFGANDAAIESSIQHINIDKYKENLIHMVNLIKNPDSPYYNPETKILFITPPPLDEKSWEETCASKGDEPNRKATITKKYAEICVETALELNVPVVNLWKIINDRVILRDYLTDGLHLNSLGNKTLFIAVMDAIKNNWPDLVPENVKDIFPDWRNVNAKDPGSSLKLGDFIPYQL